MLSRIEDAQIRYASLKLWLAQNVEYVALKSHIYNSVMYITWEVRGFIPHCMCCGVISSTWARGLHPPRDAVVSSPQRGHVGFIPHVTLWCHLLNVLRMRRLEYATCTLEFAFHRVCNLTYTTFFAGIQVFHHDNCCQ